jgi:hypothetical protein
MIFRPAPSAEGGRRKGGACSKTQIALRCYKKSPQTEPGAKEINEPYPSPRKQPSPSRELEPPPVLMDRARHMIQILEKPRKSELRILEHIRQSLRAVQSQLFIHFSDRARHRP